MLHDVPERDHRNAYLWIFEYFGIAHHTKTVAYNWYALGDFVASKNCVFDWNSVGSKMATYGWMHPHRLLQRIWNSHQVFFLVFPAMRQTSCIIQSWTEELSHEIRQNWQQRSKTTRICLPKVHRSSRSTSNCPGQRDKILHTRPSTCLSCLEALCKVLKSSIVLFHKAISLRLMSQKMKLLRKLAQAELHFEWEAATLESFYRNCLQGCSRLPQCMHEHIWSFSGHCKWIHDQAPQWLQMLSPLPWFCLDNGASVQAQRLHMPLLGLMSRDLDRIYFASLKAASLHPGCLEVVSMWNFLETIVWNETKQAVRRWYYFWDQKQAAPRLLTMKPT